MGNVSYRLSLKTVSFFICSQLQRHWPALSALVSHSITRYSIHNFLCSLFRIVFFFAEEQERVQKKTFTNWINSYLSKVSSLSIQCSSIYLCIYLSDFNRFAIEICISRRATLFFFTVLLIEGSAGRDHEVDIVYILNVHEVHEIVN